MTKRENFKRAKAVLKAVEEALPHADAICDTVIQGCVGEDDPPLLRFSNTWCEAVDPEKLKQFRTLVFFLSEAIFGVDCDNDSALKIVIIDKARDLRRPMSVVPRISDHPTFKEIWGALRSARTEARLAQGVVEQIERELEFFVEDNPQFLKDGDE